MQYEVGLIFILLPKYACIKICVIYAYIMMLNGSKYNYMFYLVFGVGAYIKVVV